MGYFKDFSPGFSRPIQILRGIAMSPFASPIWLVALLVKTYVEPKALGGGDGKER